jgi:hypothetical protein
MIEIEAEILRGSCTPVFFVGETIECEIKFKCLQPSNKSKRKSSTSSDLALSQITPTPSSSKVKFLDLNPTVDEKKMSEINESMFSLLTAYPSTSSNASSSIPTTPTDSTNKLFAPSLKSYSSGTSNEQTDISYDPECIIAWACVQLDCTCYIDESKVALPKIPLRYNISNDNESSSNTSFQPNRDKHGLSVYSSKPKILFCNLYLRPNEQKSCNMNSINKDFFN